MPAAAKEWPGGRFSCCGPRGELFLAARRPIQIESTVNDDAQLVKATLAGDRSAFGDLVERHQDRLYNTLVGVLGSRHDALDVLQDAFVQAFVKLDSFRSEAKFYTWLYRIAMNLALSHRRRRRPVVSVEDVKARLGSEPIDGRQGPEQAIEELERADILQQAIACLAEQHRQILVLREMDGCSYESIAEILDLPIGTVRSRLFRARMQLKEQLHNLLPEDADAAGQGMD
jgi:RNA polymerase sigma-70 factor, ECF subfamily